MLKTHQCWRQRVIYVKSNLKLLREVWRRLQLITLMSMSQTLHSSYQFTVLGISKVLLNLQFVFLTYCTLFLFFWKESPFPYKELFSTRWCATPLYIYTDFHNCMYYTFLPYIIIVKFVIKGALSYTLHSFFYIYWAPSNILCTILHVVHYLIYCALSYILCTTSHTVHFATILHTVHFLTYCVLSCNSEPYLKYRVFFNTVCFFSHNVHFLKLFALPVHHFMSHDLFKYCESLHITNHITVQGIFICLFICLKSSILTIALDQWRVFLVSLFLESSIF